MSNDLTIQKTYMIFPGCQIGRIRKRLWRIIAAKAYIEWRRSGRVYCVLTKYTYKLVTKEGHALLSGSVFHPQAAVRAHRLRENRNKGYAPHIDHKYINMARIWLIKARLNYGRY